LAILAAISSVASVEAVFAQATHPNFDVNMWVILHFQPDVSWVAVISGIFAIAWAVLRTGIVLSATARLLKNYRIQQKSNPAI
jgi:Zn-dependent membrane protease YugP